MWFEKKNKTSYLVPLLNKLPYTIRTPRVILQNEKFTKIVIKMVTISRQNIKQRLQVLMIDYRRILKTDIIKKKLLIKKYLNLFAFSCYWSPNKEGENLWQYIYQSTSYTWNCIFTPNTQQNYWSLIYQ